jgi:hypothetical protein
MAEEGLFRAKQMGRNRVELAVRPADIALTPDQQLPVVNDAIKAESV